MTRRDFILSYILGRLEEGTETSVDIIVANAVALWNKIRIDEATQQLSIEFIDDQDTTILSILKQWKDAIIKENKDRGE